MGLLTVALLLAVAVPFAEAIGCIMHAAPPQAAPAPMHGQRHASAPHHDQLMPVSACFNLTSLIPGETMVGAADIPSHQPAIAPWLVLAMERGAHAYVPTPRPPPETVMTLALDDVIERTARRRI